MKEVKLYNSLTNKIEPFNVIHQNKVSMYVCGPTVYNTPHIGNMRPVVVFDCLRRLLEYLGYEVTYVSNYTDVDDKIINEASKRGISEKELTDSVIKEFEDTVIKIGSKLPTITPRVTEYIPKIINYINELIKKDAAYNKDGNVYFRVEKIKDYGALSGISIEDLKVGARIEENSEKESPLDFALWKKTDKGISWDTPWGKGRPGWHTECCVMIDSIFPDHLIDIHGGGYDLKFPHHENEIAQAEAMHQNKIAHYWLHNAFINFGNEKMSKSLGNVVLAKDLINQVGGNVVRMVILSAHYRQPVNFTEETVNAAINEINKINNSLKLASLKLQSNDIKLTDGKPTSIMDNFISSLCDDLNTANALMELYNVIKLMNNELRNKECNLSLLSDYFFTVNKMLDVLGLKGNFVVLSEEDKHLYNKYLKAKEDKDFELSDTYRKMLIDKHIL